MRLIESTMQGRWQRQGGLDLTIVACAQVILIYMGSSAMKQLKYISTIVLAVMFATLLGCASTSKQEGTGEYLDDGVVTTKVKAAIFNEPSLKSSEIKVETFKGVVQLSGFVSTQADVDKAVEVVSRVKGVTSIKNDMVVKGRQ